MRKEYRFRLFFLVGVSMVLAAVLLVGMGGCATTTMTVREDVPACLPAMANATYRVDVHMTKRESATMPEWMRGIAPPHEASGKGSGIVINPEAGLILTAAHVVIEAGWDAKASITIDVKGRPKPVTLDAAVVAIDETADLAVLKVKQRFPKGAVIAEESEVVKGESVYNVGYPYDFGEMVGRGHIMRLHFSSPDGDPEYDDVMLVEISNGPGTSGSGLYSERTGKMVGIMKAYTFRYAAPGHPPTVVRVIIPVEKIRRFLEKHEIPYRSSPPGTPVCGDP